MSNGRYVDVDVDEIVAATDRALLCLIDGEEKWLPRSQVADGDGYEKGETGVTLSVTSWFAEKEGLT